MSSAVSKAVFLSYASQDAEAARRIAEALRAAGVEVWFDQNELVGGDAWDAKIRKQIKECALFVPIISANTQARREGYFRREWKQAAERTRDIAEGTPFLLPVVIDATGNGEALVPEEFRAVQWTFVRNPEDASALVTQVRRALGDPAAGLTPASGSLHSRSSPTDKKPARARPTLMLVVCALAGLVAVGAWQPWRRAAAPSATAPRPPQETRGKSIAVLPFANLGTDRENEFFADGVHEDVITNLAKIRALRVIARPSVLAFRDADTRNLKKVADELSVGTLLTGSVRRAGKQVVVSVQLIDPRSGEQLWGDRYQEEITDLFAIQTALAEKITGALKTTLTRSERAQISRRPTENLEAWELYLTAKVLDQHDAVAKPVEDIIAKLERAVLLDPGFAEAHAALANAHGNLFWFGHLDPTPRRLELARSALTAAMRLGPDLAETRLAAGILHYRGDLRWQSALDEFSRAREGLPNDANLLGWMGLANRRLGNWTESVRYFAEAAQLDPRSAIAQVSHVETLFEMRRYGEARRFADRYRAVTPGVTRLEWFAALSAWELDGDSEPARQRVLRQSEYPDTTGVQVAYQSALFARDYEAADRALLKSGLEWLAGPVGVVNEPLALYRSRVAFLRGDTEAARSLASQALGVYGSGKWTKRQESRVLLGRALANALAGQCTEAVALLRQSDLVAAEIDVPDHRHQLFEQGIVHIVLGQGEEALAVLPKFLSGYGRASPQVIRHDQFWSRLNKDPRFEEALKQVKPL